MMALAQSVGARVRDALVRAYRRVGPVLLFLLLLIGQRLVELTPLKHWLATQAYSVMQLGLGLFSDADGVVVVDITDLLPAKGVTPRRELLDLMTHLKDAGARAIGVDIDFSPENNLFVAADDLRFFEACRSFPIPIFLGVARTAGNGREAWLGKREFAPLAAGIVIPEASGTVPDGGAPGPYPLFIPPLDDIPRLDAEGSRAVLPSMAMALASVVKPGVEHELTTPGLISEPVVERTVIKGVSVPEFPVKYGFIRPLQRASISAKWDAAGKLAPISPAVAGQIVLIGDLKGSSQSDVFTTQGSAATASGVLIHASATLTLMKAPLSVLNEWVRAGLELVLLLWIGAVLGEPRKKLTSRQKRHVLWVRWGLAVALPIGAWRLIAEGILWLDWFFVPVVAVIDSFLNEAEDKMVEDPKPLDQEMAGTL